MDNCKHCGAIIQVGTKYCINCGQIVENSNRNICNNLQDNNMKMCNSCGRIVNKDVSFCNYCGQAFDISGAKNEETPKKEKKFSFRIRCMFVLFIFASVAYIADGVIGWGIILGVCGVLMSPPFLKRNAIGFSAFVFILALISIFAGGSVISEKNEKVDVVKSGSFNDYPDITIGSAFYSFFTDCEWEYIDEYVEFRGKCYSDNELVPVVMRFYFETSERFALEYMSVDGVRQNGYGIDDVLDAVYESYYEEY